jgi:lipoyl(octanoyl) transferase
VELQYISLGQVSYQPALDIQLTIRQERIANQRPDTLLLLEHSPVLTLGRRAREEDILVDTEALRSRGVDIVRIDRGGEVTYHGPGQLVGYLIFNLSITGGSIKRFVYLL